MVTEVVPIKVKIGLRPNGHADHPAWERLPMIAGPLAGNLSPERIDIQVRQHMCGSWHYDKQSGHEVSTVDSPRGMQWGMLLVSRRFADEAIATFPTLISVMTQAETQTFWDTKAYAHLPDENIDGDTLNALQTRRNLLLARNASQARIDAVHTDIDKALDPNDTSPGVKRNLLRRWADQFTRLGITFHPSVQP